MCVYNRINELKVELMNQGIKKSGNNSYAGYKYFELSDLLSVITPFCVKNNMFIHTTFSDTTVTLTIKDLTDNSEVVYTSPISLDAGSKMNGVMSVGSCHTYMRRYMLMVAFDIIEDDMIDSQKPQSNQQPKQFTPQPIVQQSIPQPMVQQPVDDGIPYGIVNVIEGFNYKLIKKKDGSPVWIILDKADEADGAKTFQNYQ